MSGRRVREAVTGAESGFGVGQAIAFLMAVRGVDGGVGADACAADTDAQASTSSAVAAVASARCTCFQLVFSPPRLSNR